MAFFEIFSTSPTKLSALVRGVLLNCVLLFMFSGLKNATIGHSLENDKRIGRIALILQISQLQQLPAAKLSLAFKYVTWKQ